MFTLEIRPGEGGDDAMLFATELYNALTIYAAKFGKVSQLNLPQRTLCASLNFEAASAVERFVGTHRIQRIPKNDPRHRRHTSTATVTLLEDSTLAKIVVNPDDCQIEFFRGSGPGGQHRNKTSTAVRLRHLPTGIMITRTSGRSQSTNLDSAKAQLLAELTSRAQNRQAKTENFHRRSQSVTNRSAKTFTHNAQRDTTLDHSTQERWRMSSFLQGKI